MRRGVNISSDSPTAGTYLTDFGDHKLMGLGGLLGSVCSSHFLPEKQPEIMAYRLDEQGLTSNYDLLREIGFRKLFQNLVRHSNPHHPEIA